MPLMLAVMFACLLVGVLAPRLGGRHQAAITLLATSMTVIYLFVGRSM